MEFGLLRDPGARFWRKHRVSRVGAALSFYMVFSLTLLIVGLRLFLFGAVLTRVIEGS